MPLKFGFPNNVTKHTELTYYVGNYSRGTFMKNTKLTVTFHIGGKQVDKLTEEQKERMAQRLSEAMSIYYTAHIDEFKKIKN